MRKRRVKRSKRNERLVSTHLPKLRKERKKPYSLGRKFFSASLFRLHDP
jgi:hypothetical protein